MFGFKGIFRLRRRGDARVGGAYAPRFRRMTDPPPPRPHKFPGFQAPPMPKTAPCKDGFKAVEFDEDGHIHIVDDVYITIGGVKYKILGIESVDAAPVERIVQDD